MRGKEFISPDPKDQRIAFSDRVVEDTGTILFRFFLEPEQIDIQKVKKVLDPYTLAFLAKAHEGNILNMAIDEAYEIKIPPEIAMPYNRSLTIMNLMPSLDLDLPPALTEVDVLPKQYLQYVLKPPQTHIDVARRITEMTDFISGILMDRMLPGMPLGGIEPGIRTLAFFKAGQILTPTFRT